MTTGLQYTEDYTDENSTVWQFTRAGGFRPRPPGYQGPESFYDFIRTIAKETPHGERFAYKTVNTDTLAWVLRRVTGRSAQRAAARAAVVEARRRGGRVLHGR